RAMTIPRRVLWVRVALAAAGAQLMLLVWQTPAPMVAGSDRPPVELAQAPTVPERTSCPCSLWTPAATPAIAAFSDSTSVEVGVRLQSERSGFISGIRFYKGEANTGTHNGNLWSASGTLLARTMFESESARGWQHADFIPAVSIGAGKTYVLSYHAPAGH